MPKNPRRPLLLALLPLAAVAGVYGAGRATTVEGVSDCPLVIRFDGHEYGSAPPGVPFALAERLGPAVQPPCGGPAESEEVPHTAYRVRGLGPGVALAVRPEGDGAAYLVAARRADGKLPAEVERLARTPSGASAPPSPAPTTTG
ncbi:DUF6281 family protein [Streptomyces sp. NPDC002248]